jgi:hypothetical protein
MGSGFSRGCNARNTHRKTVFFACMARKQCIGIYIRANVNQFSLRAQARDAAAQKMPLPQIDQSAATY